MRIENTPLASLYALRESQTQNYQAIQEIKTNHDWICPKLPESLSIGHLTVYGAILAGIGTAAYMGIPLVITYAKSFRQGVKNSDLKRESKGLPKRTFAEKCKVYFGGTLDCLKGSSYAAIPIAVSSAIVSPFGAVAGLSLSVALQEPYQVGREALCSPKDLSTLSTFKPQSLTSNELKVSAPFAKLK